MTMFDNLSLSQTAFCLDEGIMTDKLIFSLLESFCRNMTVPAAMASSCFYLLCILWQEGLSSRNAMSYWACREASNAPRRQEDRDSAKIILNNVNF